MERKRRGLILKLQAAAASTRQHLAPGVDSRPSATPAADGPEAPGSDRRSANMENGRGTISCDKPKSPVRRKSKSLPPYAAGCRTHTASRQTDQRRVAPGTP